MPEGASSPKGAVSARPADAWRETAAGGDSAAQTQQHAHAPNAQAEAPSAPAAREAREGAAAESVGGAEAAPHAAAAANAASAAAAEGASSAATAAPARSTAYAGGKVVILFKATGDAPILKQSKFKVSAADRVDKVVDFVKKMVRRENVFLYVGSTFMPAPDARVGDLFDCYGTGGKLVLQYALNMAWG